MVVMSPPFGWEECADRVEHDEVYLCWLWTGEVDQSGYPRFDGRLKTVRVHRLAYELLRGPIPSGHQLDHLCRRTHCVNPGHMEAVTPKENCLRRGRAGVRRRARLAKDVCAEGHNLFRNGRRTPEGGQVCLICSRRYL